MAYSTREAKGRTEKKGVTDSLSTLLGAAKQA